MQALARFQNDPSCCVLVMDGSAAVGLDLSFVSRVYLMEPIWDKSLEEQVSLDAASFELCCALFARWVDTNTRSGLLSARALHLHGSLS
jgi:hypothetical protein